MLDNSIIMSGVVHELSLCLKVLYAAGVQVIVAAGDSGGSVKGSYAKCISPRNLPWLHLLQNTFKIKIKTFIMDKLQLTNINKA